jgi:hypothetical protein
MPTSKGQSAARQWKRATNEELELPSGNVALVKRPGMDAFIREGIIPDSLMPIINEAVAKGKGLPPSKVQEMVQDPKIVDAMFDAMDRVLARVVQEPLVQWHKREKPDAPGTYEVIPDAERDTDTYVYTDEVFFEDKAFLFNYAVGGTRDLEQFRKQSESGLASVQSGDALASSS